MIRVWRGSVAGLVVWAFMWAVVGAALSGCQGPTMVCYGPGPVGQGPNVVLILADDLGIGDLGAYNAGSKVPTPNLDRLAAGGMRFTDAHSPSAVCTPTRYGILTGRYAWRSRLKSWVLGANSRALIEPGRATLPGLLGSNRYQTAVIGKWHLGFNPFDPANPEENNDLSLLTADDVLETGPHTVGFGYSKVIGASTDHAPYLWIENGSPTEAATAHTEGSKRRWAGGGGFWRAGAMQPSFVHERVLPQTAEWSVEHLGLTRRSAGRSNKPFFLYVPFAAPHTPWLPTEEWQGETDAGWYGDFVAQLDHNVGLILDEIDRIEKADPGRDTIVIFTSDNGSHWREQDEQNFDHLANLDYRGMKADIHESGHRVPLIVRWPGVTEAGTVSDATVGLHDLYATIADGLGIELAPGEAPDSESFIAALRGDAFVRPEPVVHHSGAGHFAIRDGDWKLIERLGSGGFTNPKDPEPEEGGPAGQLYNLADDPGETTNRWLDRPEVVRGLRAQLDRIRASE